jgi:GNAT superfamily N-acetyltransferase
MPIEGGAAMGCVALLAMEGTGGERGSEPAKMGVTPEAQGKGAGRKLIQGAIDHARGLGATRLYLETNSALKPALKLYADAGFQHVKGPPSPYARADVQMELWLG